MKQSQSDRDGMGRLFSLKQQNNAVKCLKLT